jgi:hypothetical protein
VASDAPCKIVERLAFPNGAPGAYLQLDGDDPSRLEEFLAPLLP